MVIFLICPITVNRDQLVTRLQRYKDNVIMPFRSLDEVLLQPRDPLKADLVIFDFRDVAIDLSQTVKTTSLVSTMLTGGLNHFLITGNEQTGWRVSAARQRPKSYQWRYRFEAYNCQDPLAWIHPDGLPRTGLVRQKFARLRAAERQLDRWHFHRRRYRPARIIGSL